MKVGYTLLDRDIVGYTSNKDNLPVNSTHAAPPDAVGEGVALIMVALVGGVGNILTMGVTLACPTFRRMSSAFLFHHCLLDAIKSGLCVPFGLSLLMATEIPRCDVLGAGYILLMTVSAYNLLALVVNEEYQCSFVSRRCQQIKQNPYSSSLNQGSLEEGGDGCCIAFGVVIIWFTTVLLHLGVAFLPGSSEYSPAVGNCIYRYGVTKNYVIHVLWVILVTGAMVVAVSSFLHFFRTLRLGARSRKWTLLHKSLSSLSASHNNIMQGNGNQDFQGRRHQVGGSRQIESTYFAENADAQFGEGEETHYEFDDMSTQKALLQARRYLRRVYIMLAMVVSFVLCWYPLFLLTLVDVHFRQPPSLYRKLMILAWVQPVTTPVFCALIYLDMARGERTARDIYSNALPMTTSRSGEALRQDTNQTSSFCEERAGVVDSSSSTMGFQNHNFHHFSPHNHVARWSLQSMEPLPSPPPLPTPPPPPPPPPPLRRCSAVLDSPTSLSTSQHQDSESDTYTRCETLTLSQCETIVNFNSEDQGRCHTLIM
ncbi:trace amine-associated receptor 4-like [Plakobranchus ocellatus]|uniref:Trace amine-associated receptor 4-like n=1 Tax=Plakobranchus ocellatus TaxID=259542 RepID=A0AAV4AEN0_9GAST|nr:trace amine-associated receptor 4-like [Plakobranchus ocellatus]